MHTDTHIYKHKNTSTIMQIAFEVKILKTSMFVNIICIIMKTMQYVNNLC